MKRKNGLADSPFFSPPVPSVPVAVAAESPEVKIVPPPGETAIPRYRDTTLDFIASRVKEFGKEAATHRFTAAEKQALSKIVFAFRSRGIKTTENELLRIATNSLITEYQQYGNDSLLALVLRQLHR